MTFRATIPPAVKEAIDQLVENSKREAISRLVAVAHPAGDNARALRKAEVATRGAKKKLTTLIKATLKNSGAT